MNIEYEATFLNIDKEEIRNRLKKAGALLIKPEFLQKRVVFHLPKGHEIVYSWARVRDEGDQITMSIKIIESKKIAEEITSQKEVCLKVDDFKEAVLFLKTLGCRKKSYQETKRELWKLDGVEVTIDEWPFLEPFVEVEGDSEESTKTVAEKLDFNWSEARFCAIGKFYSEKYNISLDVINNDIKKITFEGKNPFDKKKD